MVLSKRVLASTLIILILTLDQLTKNFASRNLQIVCNEGIAFGLGSDATLIALVVVAFVFWILISEKKALSLIGLSLIFGGGLSNLIDRVSFGCVLDFISISNFPSFNLADSAITAGAIIIFADIIFLRK